jgi:hypothetical protein
MVAGPHVRNAALRHLADLEHAPGRGFTWNLEAAMGAVDFFPDVLRLNGGQFEGRPFELHPSQVFIVGSLFGWQRADDSRRFRRAYIEIGKGNGKSPLAAGIGMYCLLADGEPRAEIYAAASKMDQAKVLFRDAIAMYEQSPALYKRLIPSGSQDVWNLADPQSGSFFRPIASDRGQSGPRPSCALCDEVHEHRDGTMIEMLERGFKWRRQPLLVMITNSGTDRQSACWQEHLHAVRVAAGTMAPDDDATFIGEPIDDQDLDHPGHADEGFPAVFVQFLELAEVLEHRHKLDAVAAHQRPGRLDDRQMAERREFIHEEKHPRLIRLAQPHDRAQGRGEDQSKPAPMPLHHVGRQDHIDRDRPLFQLAKINARLPEIGGDFRIVEGFGLRVGRGHDAFDFAVPAGELACFHRQRRQSPAAHGNCCAGDAVAGLILARRDHRLGQQPAHFSQGGRAAILQTHMHDQGGNQLVGRAAPMRIAALDRHEGFRQP